MEEITIQQKPKFNKVWYFSLPKDLFDVGILDSDKEYKITIEEVPQDG